MKKLLFTLIVILMNIIPATAQDTVDMADLMRSSGKIYVVVAVAMVVLAGIFIYLITLDRKVTRMENRLKDKTLN
jgi:CcmD family protein